MMIYYENFIRQKAWQKGHGDSYFQSISKKKHTTHSSCRPGNFSSPAQVHLRFCRRSWYRDDWSSPQLHRIRWANVLQVLVVPSGYSITIDIHQAYIDLFESGVLWLKIAQDQVAQSPTHRLSSCSLLEWLQIGILCPMFKQTQTNPSNVVLVFPPCLSYSLFLHSF